MFNDIAIFFRLSRELKIKAKLWKSAYYTYKARQLIKKLVKEFEVPSVISYAIIQHDRLGVKLQTISGGIVYRQGGFMAFTKDVRNYGLPSPIILIYAESDFYDTLAHEFAHYLDYVNKYEYSDTPGTPGYSPFPHDAFHFNLRTVYVKQKLEQIQNLS